MDRRSPERLRAHYELEKAWAKTLRDTPASRRPTMYKKAYDAVFAEIYDHPQLADREHPSARARTIAKQWRFLRRFVGPSDILLEIGTGDAALAIKASATVRGVVAVDVSEEITSRADLPKNVRLVLIDGTHFPLPDASIDVAYSNQLMEHLHPDDALAQLREIARVLKPGGRYVCITPNRLSGPHDISGFFDDEATGFHLKEYTNRELAGLFLDAGFSRAKAYAGAKGFYVRAGRWGLEALESLLFRIRMPWRRRIARLWPVRALLGIAMVGEK